MNHLKKYYQENKLDLITTLWMIPHILTTCFIFGRGVDRMNHFLILFGFLMTLRLGKWTGKSELSKSLKVHKELRGEAFFWALLTWGTILAIYLATKF